MSVNISDIQNFCVEILDASQPSPTAYGSIVSERFKSGEFDFAIRLGDLACLRAMLNNPGDGRRAAFLTAVNVAHGDVIPAHVGPIDDCYFQITGGIYDGGRTGAKIWPLNKMNELEQENRNPQNNPFIEPHAIVEGDAAFHNGEALMAGGASSAQFFVRIANFTYNPAGTVIQSPDEFARAIACAALAILMMKDGQRVSAGAQFEQMYRAEMASLNVQNPSPLDAAVAMAA